MSTITTAPTSKPKDPRESSRPLIVPNDRWLDEFDGLTKRLRDYYMPGEDQHEHQDELEVIFDKALDDEVFAVPHHSTFDMLEQADSNRSVRVRLELFAYPGVKLITKDEDRRNIEATYLVTVTRID